MSYIGSRRRRTRRGMSGLSSRPYGPGVARSALGTITEILTVEPLLVNDPTPAPKPTPKPKPVPRTQKIGAGSAMHGVPDWYRAMSGCSLGDDAPTTGAATLTDGTATWQQAMLSTSQRIAAAQEEFTKRESLQRWIQIGATLAIPLSAAIWRAIFRGSRDSGI